MSSKETFYKDYGLTKVDKDFLNKQQVYRLFEIPKKGKGLNMPPTQWISSANTSGSNFIEFHEVLIPLSYLTPGDDHLQRFFVNIPRIAEARVLKHFVDNVMRRFIVTLSINNINRASLAPTMGEYSNNVPIQPITSKHLCTDMRSEIEFVMGIESVLDQRDWFSFVLSIARHQA
eukprot:gene17508-20888_t